MVKKIETHDSLSPTLTDLMTSLMVIFILLLVVYLNNTARAGVDVSKQVREELSANLGKVRGIEVKQDERDPLAILVIVHQNLMDFALNEKELPPGGRTFLSHMIPRMSAILCSERFRTNIDSVVVEGHTDSQPVRGKSRLDNENFNLQLSQERAMSVVVHSLQALKKYPAQFEYFLEFLSASGRGQRDPVSNKDGSENFNASRRVIFKIRIKSSEKQTFEKALKSVK